MPTQVERLESLASHLLDGFLSLRERYSLLHPLLFDREVCASRGSGKQARGFYSLRHSLFLSCVQDMAKLVTDGDTRAPSIRNITAALEDTLLADALRARYAAWYVPSIEEETDPEIVEALRRIEFREQAERRMQFDELHGELVTLQRSLAAAPSIAAFRTIRDRITAHTEVRFVADKYQLIDISTLGIKWSDLKTTIIEIQRAVELIGLIVRNAGFAWDMLEEQLTNSARAFWLQRDAVS